MMIQLHREGQKLFVMYSAQNVKSPFERSNNKLGRNEILLIEIANLGCLRIDWNVQMLPK